jgi:hypothetical protein
MTDILDEREKTHGSYANTAATAQAIKDVMKQGTNWQTLDDTQREALDLIATKIARVLSGNPHEVDHWRDVAGYANLIVREFTRVQAVL